ncbi:MAG TPA: ferritin-like domain-containing protein [Polyangiaceae bacterium]|nr:ferritin-like domain-containing protein [Polyangiaceae bacterium]
MEQASPFEWRSRVGYWRWLLLGSLGLTANACGGRSDGGEQGLGGEPGGGGDSGYGGAFGRGGASATAGSAGISNIPAGVGGGSAAGGGGTIGVTHPPDPLVCMGPTTELGGNWERCLNGIVHRRSLGECPSALPRSQVFTGPFTDDDSIYYGSLDPGAPDAGAEGGASAPAPEPPPLCDTADCCFQDSDCTAALHGHCERWSEYDGIPVPTCRYGCVSDSDCDAGSVCLCGDVIGECVQASCRVDADCGDTRHCTPNTRAPGCPGVTFECQSDSDQCASDQDCVEGFLCSRSWDAPFRSCQPMSCNVGRPFLIDGRPRLAPPCERSDWYPEPSPLCAADADSATDPSPELRASLRAGWLEQASMEHASVASFARFSLELASLGAPAALARGAASAMLDEIGHARECYALARRYSDADVGPGPLALDGALAPRDVEAIVVAAIEEGCIGETVAALEAAEALAHCDDPWARRVLEQIQRDETEHARLAWHFVSWALSTAPEPVLRAAQRAFRRELDRYPVVASAPAALAPRDRELLRHGLVPDSLRDRLRQRVLREVVEPCADALFRDPALAAASGAGVARVPERGSAC